MSDIAIRVEHLGKQYRIGGPKARYKTLRDSIVGAMTAPVRWLSAPHVRKPRETIWALKDVSFEVQRGEVVGIIGRNGAGKSTLLKILSSITQPTEGRVMLNGRVGSLLEVGTGFHAELTGRENIYLNGAILGMKRAEIERRFDEIVAFAEVEKFIDTPVKHYSSGMYVRLAFAVAAHLEPEILIVDEVLAVGDIAFQKKCLNKMGDVSREGRTVLLVSHNMVSISALCVRAIWLEAGYIRASGDAKQVVFDYEQIMSNGINPGLGRITRNDVRTSPAAIEWVELRNAKGDYAVSYGKDEILTLLVGLQGELPPAAYLEWSVCSQTGHRISSGGTFMDSHFRFSEKGNTLVCRIGPLPLAIGSYIFSFKTGVLPGNVLSDWSDAIPFRIDECDVDGQGFHFDSRRGDVVIPAKYEWIHLNDSQ